MKVVTGIVVDGKIVVEGEPLTDGSKVTVLAPEGEGDTFELPPEQEALLLEAIGEIERGEGIDARKFMKQLGQRD
ncbi:MAG TPA: hypothetical protein VGC53_03535 [Vicinamibacteria bacterium]